MSNPTLVKPMLPGSETRLVSLSQPDPEKVIEFGQRVARALVGVLAKQPKKVMINNRQYLTFSDWLLLSKFYGLSVVVEWVRSATDDKGKTGFESRSVVYDSNQNIVASAESACYRSESSWEVASSYALKSMCQTRSCAKALKNALSFLIPLASSANSVPLGDTPAEEMLATDNAPSDSPDYFDRELAGQENTAHLNEWLYDNPGCLITSKQKGLLRTLVLEKVLDENEREHRLANLDMLSKTEASEQIGVLLEQPSAV